MYHNGIQRLEHKLYISTVSFSVNASRDLLRFLYSISTVKLFIPENIKILTLVIKEFIISEPIGDFVLLLIRQFQWFASLALVAFVWFWFCFTFRIRLVIGLYNSSGRIGSGLTNQSISPSTSSSSWCWFACNMLQLQCIYEICIYFKNMISINVFFYQ